MPIKNIGLVISAFGVGIFIGAYLGGFLCDKFDYYKLSIAMLLASGTMISLIPFFVSFITLIIIVFFGGLFHGVFKPANTLNLFRDSSRSDRSRLNGLYRVAINLGIGVASLFGGILAGIYFPLVFWIDGLTSLIAAGILFYFYHPTIAIIENVSKDMKKINFDNVFVSLCILLLINCLVFFQIQATYPIYLNEYYHISASSFGYVFLLNCIIIVLFEVPLLNAVKDTNQMLVAMIGSALICFSMFMLPFGRNLFWAIGSCVILTLGEILLFTTILTLIVDRSNETNKGKYIGIYQSIFGIASMLAPVLGNYVYSIQPSLLWYDCGLIGLGSVIIFQFANILTTKSKSTSVSSNF